MAVRFMVMLRWRLAGGHFTDGQKFTSAKKQRYERNPGRRCLLPPAGESVPKEEQLNAKDQKSLDLGENTPVISALGPPESLLSADERTKYEEDIAELYKQLDDKVGQRGVLVDDVQVNLLLSQFSRNTLLAWHTKTPERISSCFAAVICTKSHASQKMMYK